MGGFVEVGGGDVRAILLLTVLPFTALGFDRHIDLPGRGENSSQPGKHKGCGGRWVKRLDNTYECRRCGEVTTKPETS